MILQEREETLQSTLDFNVYQQTELEQKLKSTLATVEQLQAQLKVSTLLSSVSITYFLMYSLEVLCLNTGLHNCKFDDLPL